MGTIEQFDMFLPQPEEIDYVKNDIKEAIELIHRVRKSIFAKHGEIKKMQMEINDRLDIIERYICRGKG